MSRIIKKKSNMLTIEAGHADRRIDNFLLAHFKSVPKSRVYQMLRRGEVRVNGGRIKQGYRLKPGDQVRLPPVVVRAASGPAAVPARLQDLLRGRIIHCDRNIIAVNKPAGMVVHSGTGRDLGMIDIMRTLPEAGSRAQDLQLVHRLDRETSGCLLFARSMPVLRKLHAMFNHGEVEKVYQSLLAGNLRGSSRTVDVPLHTGKVISGERMVTAVDDGKPACTVFRVLQRFADACLVRVILKTGRTHQIRVHARHMGHPVAGDDKYGDRDFNRVMQGRGLRRLFLHAEKLVIDDPDGKGRITLHAPLPADLREVIDCYDGRGTG